MLYRLEAGRFASRLKARLPDEQRPSTPRGSPGGKAPAHPPTPDDAEESTSLTDRLDGSRDVLEVVSGSREPLLAPSPLRTGHEGRPSSGSSPGESIRFG